MSGFLRFTLLACVSGVKNLQNVIPTLDKMLNQEMSKNDKSLVVEQGTLNESSQRVDVLCMQCSGDLNRTGMLKCQHCL